MFCLTCCPPPPPALELAPGGGHVAAGPVEVPVVGVVALALAKVVEQLPQVVVVGRLEEV